MVTVCLEQPYLPGDLQDLRTNNFSERQNGPTMFTELPFGDRPAAISHHALDGVITGANINATEKKLGSGGHNHSPVGLRSTA